MGDSFVAPFMVAEFGVNKINRFFVECAECVDDDVRASGSLGVGFGVSELIDRRGPLPFVGADGRGRNDCVRRFKPPSDGVGLW